MLWLSFVTSTETEIPAASSIDPGLRRSLEQRYWSSLPTPLLLVQPVPHLVLVTLLVQRQQAISTSSRAGALIV